jgi:cytochrome P450
VHSCVGRVLAGLEADALLGAVARHIERFEPAGEPEPWMTTIGHGPERLPVRFFAATGEVSRM